MGATSTVSPGPGGEVHPVARRAQLGIFNSIYPTLLVFALFAGAIFVVVLPSFERYFINQKKTTSATVTQVALSILDCLEQQRQSGGMSLEEAQRLGSDRIRNLRYGADGKGYLWVNDLQPAMIAHPYRPDLEGKGLSEFKDIDGKYLFVEMVDMVSRNKAGYIEYKWQWQDEPDRLAPKLSYVGLFEPWGWVVGSGVYLDDVRRETGALTWRMTVLSSVILCLMLLLFASVVWRGLRERTRRRQAEESLEQYHAQLEDLVEARTAQLQAALAKVTTLRGLLPICSNCKKIRNDSGYWQQIESFVSEHSLAEFTHGICPDCGKALYPDYWGRSKCSGSTA